MATTNTPLTDFATSNSDLINLLPEQLNNSILKCLAGDDTVNGSTDREYISGGAGNDIIFGGGVSNASSSNLPSNLPWFDVGNLVNINLGDVLSGGQGNDTLVGSKSRDALNGGQGNDSLVGGIGKDSIWAGVGNDIIIGDGDNDYMWGSGGDDSFSGGAGNDYFAGGTGNDTLLGGTGNDILNAATYEGADLGEVGAGELDVVQGGKGKDVFVVGDQLQGNYYAIDSNKDYLLIEDFSVKQDKLQLVGNQNAYLTKEENITGSASPDIGIYEKSSNDLICLIKGSSNNSNISTRSVGEVIDLKQISIFV